MPRQLPLLNHFRETRLFLNRTVTALVVVILLSIGLIARLAYLQVVQHELYTTLSDSNRMDIVPIGPNRGLIYDRNGVMLAENRPTFSLEIVPERVEALEPTLTELAKLISIGDTDVQDFRKRLRRKRRFEGVPIRLQLSDEEVAVFAVNRYRFPGVEIEARLTRHYPLGALTAHALGYVGRINERELQRIDNSNYAATQHIGKVGVERFYEDVLHGKVGFQQVETNARGRVLRVLERTPPVPGSDLYLNLDSGLQAAAARALGENRGAVVAIDPSNGGVLAMVSSPAYVPDLFVNGIDAKSYHELQENPDQPLFNRALRGQYPPGSTIKPFIALAGLDYQVTSPDYGIYDPGWFKINKQDEHKYRDWRKGGHGWVKLDRAISESCDTYFYDLGLKLGIDRMYAFLTRFGLGQPTGVDIVEELAGLVPSRDWKRGARNQPWYPGETVITAIGQGFMLATPLQLASAAATLGSRGHHLAPRLLHALKDPRTGYQTPPPMVRDTISLRNPANWERVIHAMEEVVHGERGTARKVGAGAQYRFAGKTGTAQVFGIKQDEKYVASEVDLRLRDHALFIAFAPADEPRIALSVVVENGGSGSGTAAPIARQVLDAYLLEPKE